MTRSAPPPRGCDEDDDQRLERDIHSCLQSIIFKTPRKEWSCPEGYNQLHWKEMGFSGAVSARDVWAGKDLDKIGDDYKVSVPRHGVVLLVVR